MKLQQKTQQRTPAAEAKTDEAPAGTQQKRRKRLSLLIMSQLIVIGEVRAVHGLKGHFKITSYTETPDDVFRYGPEDLGKNIQISL